MCETLLIDGPARNAKRYHRCTADSVTHPHGNGKYLDCQLTSTDTTDTIAGVRLTSLPGGSEGRHGDDTRWLGAPGAAESACLHTARCCAHQNALKPIRKTGILMIRLRNQPLSACVRIHQTPRPRLMCTSRTNGGRCWNRLCSGGGRPRGSDRRCRCAAPDLVCSS
jgi:hypothetical protein